MKQNITVEQLKKLNKDQLKKLYPLHPCPYLIKIVYTEKYHLQVTEEDYINATHNINIGTMIEILDKYDKDYIQCIFKTSNNEWCCTTSDDYEGYDRSHIELCDELWEVLKNILD